MKFEYNNTPYTVDVKDKSYEIPTYTAFFGNKDAEYQQDLINATTGDQIYTALSKWLALYLGADFAETEYPHDTADINEMSALVRFLRTESQNATAQAVAQYMPNNIVKSAAI
jgi:hypothetical protein